MRPRGQASLRRIVGFTAGFLIALSIILVTDASTNRPVGGEVLGELDLMAYCDGGIDPLMAALRTDDAFGWRCVGLRNGIWGFDEIDFDAACRQQYGRRAQARTTDPEQPDSWQCVSQ